MLKGSEASGSYLFAEYRGWKYHIADKNKRFYLCGCTLTRYKKEHKRNKSYKIKVINAHTK